MKITALETFLTNASLRNYLFIPNSIELLAAVKAALPFPIAVGERLYTLVEGRFTIILA